MMTPLCLETVRCLEDGIVGTPAEADMALIYGIGFPPFRGGALRYIDAMGLEAFVAQPTSWPPNSGHSTRRPRSCARWRATASVSIRMPPRPDLPRAIHHQLLIKCRGERIR